MSGLGGCLRCNSSYDGKFQHIIAQNKLKGQLCWNFPVYLAKRPFFQTVEWENFTVFFRKPPSNRRWIFARILFRLT
jgi:hypothetical protein